jgi:hypothetical protein
MIIITPEDIYYYEDCCRDSKCSKSGVSNETLSKRLFYEVDPYPTHGNNRLYTVSVATEQKTARCGVSHNF